MEVATSLAPLDRIFGMSGAVDDPHNVPISLRIIRHEDFEVWLRDSMPSHDVVEVMPKKTLEHPFLGFEVIASDGHDTLIGPVIHVVSHDGPLGHAA
jgi:hypothetical protein